MDREFDAVRSDTPAMGGDPRYRMNDGPRG
jgi:hypothetical protein